MEKNLRNNLIRFSSLICLLTISCAPPAITSDHIMFPSTAENDTKPDKKLILDFSSQFGLEFPGFGDQMLEKTREIDGNTNDETLEYSRNVIPIESMYRISFFKLNLTNKNFNWGLSLQTVGGFPGLDATVKIFDSYYVSSAAYLYGVDFMIQKRTKWDGKRGEAKGFYARYRLHQFSYNINRPDCQDIECPSPPAHGYWEGFPSLFAGYRYKKFWAGHRTKKWGQGDLSLNITAGYNFTFRAPALQFSWVY